MKFTITATIPTTQYGNIQPVLETEAETYEEARDIALSRMEELWERYCEPGRTLKRNDRQKLEALIGGTIYFEPSTHTYSNEAGEKYTSGSEYARKFEEPFDQVNISKAMAKKYGVSAADIVAMWEAKSSVSRGLGTALHAALEMYGKYDEVARAMERTALHDSPLIVEAITSFFAGRKEHAQYEVLVVDHVAKRAGRIDRLSGGMGNAYIEDFKTDVDVTKNLPKYRKQLSFYAAILKANDWKVLGLRVHHWDGKYWTTHELEVEDV